MSRLSHSEVHMVHRIGWLRTFKGRLSQSDISRVIIYMRTGFPNE